MPKPYHTIAITGATGFVGAHLVRYFSRLGYQVIAIGRQKTPPRALLDYATWQQADITEPIPDIDADIVIHCAGKASDSGSMDSFIKSNVDGTKNVWKAAHQCKWFVFISSSSVYANSKKKLKESDADIKNKLSKYGKSKLLAENFLLQQKENDNIIILRPRAIFGTHDRVLLPRILNLVKKKYVLLPGSLDVDTSMTHINNLVYTIHALLNKKKISGTFNIADPQPYNLREVVSTLLNTIYTKKLEYKPIPITILKIIARINNGLSIPSKITSQGLDYMSKSFVLDTTKITKVIGENQSDFYTSLPMMSDWVDFVGIDRVRSGDVDLPWVFIQD